MSPMWTNCTNFHRWKTSSICHLTQNDPNASHRFLMEQLKDTHTFLFDLLHGAGWKWRQRSLTGDSVLIDGHEQFPVQTGEEEL